MKYFKKYPIFFVVMAVLLVLFAAGAVYDFMLFQSDKASLRALNKSMHQYNSTLATDPTQKSIDDSQKNIKALEAHLMALEKDLTRESEHIFKPLTAKEGFQLREQLRGMVNNWRREAKNKDIVVPEDMDFGFKKYVAANADSPKDDSMPFLWKQACVLNFINQKLFNCKSEQSPMAILNIQREILPSEGVKEDSRARRIRTSSRNQNSASLKGDNFKIDENITARKAGSLDTLAYRFVFTGHTDVLRRFLNQLKNFDAMLVVRSIDVKPADMAYIASSAETPEAGTESTDASSAFGTPTDAAGQPVQTVDENKVPVVTDNISEFTVVIEYVEVVKDAPQTAKTDKPAAEKKAKK